MLTAASASSVYYFDPYNERFSKAEPMIKPNVWIGVTAVVSAAGRLVQARDNVRRPARLRIIDSSHAMNAGCR
jgi:hypothetical protein